MYIPFSLPSEAQKHGDKARLSQHIEPSSRSRSMSRDLIRST